MANLANLAHQRLLSLIVDRYLNDHNFSQTRTTFRNEIPLLFDNSPEINQIQMDIMGLDIMPLDDMLKEWNLAKQFIQQHSQEMFLIKIERERIKSLLECMQHHINFYYFHTGKVPVTNFPEAPTLFPTGVNTNAGNGNVSTPAVLDLERFRRETDIFQTQLLLFSMQNLINTYSVQ